MGKQSPQRALNKEAGVDPSRAVGLVHAAAQVRADETGEMMAVVRDDEGYRVLPLAKAQQDALQVDELPYTIVIVKVPARG